MSAVLERLRTAAPAAFADVPVAFAYLFGSHASGHATARSDVDVAVHLRPDVAIDHLALRMGLAGLLEREIDAGPVEVVVLDDAPVALAGRIRENGRLFYCVDDVQRVRYESRISREYHDFKIHEERSARERLARLAEPR